MRTPAHGLRLLLAAIFFALPAGSLFAATPLHHYDFNGDTVRDLVGSVDGTLVSGAEVKAGVLALDGATGYVEFPENLIPPAPSFSVSFFAYERAPGQQFVEIISQGFSGGPGFYIGYQDRLFRIGDLVLTTGAAFPDDRAWHHYAVTAGLDETRLYVDGNLVGNFNAIFTVDGGTTTRLGRQFEPFAEFFNGSLDELWVFDGVLSESEILDLSKRPLQPAGIEIGFFAGLNITGTPGGVYKIEYSLEAQNPTWTSLTNLTLQSSPFFWVDPQSSTNPLRRFYRALALP